MSYLKEDNGKSSALRAVFVGGMIWSMFLGTVIIFAGLRLRWEPSTIIAVFTGVFLSSAGVFTGLKLAQKPMEAKKKE